MILEQIQNDLKEAMKAGETDKVSALRFLLSQIKNREIDKRAELTDEEIVSVNPKQAKQRRESVEAFKQGGRDDLVVKEQAELDLLSKYLPQKMGQAELEKIVSGVISQTNASGISDFGKVMKEVMEKVKGQADGGSVSEIVKKQLAGG
ncbi:MAG: GatB/YqeY domain-containing protein [Candidatus Curtissbacteria bacterium]|nr:GatB/YqeY domain-containing protein [Candidatus Curtissbacteria bacterium]